MRAIKIVNNNKTIELQLKWTIETNNIDPIATNTRKFVIPILCICIIM